MKLASTSISGRTGSRFPERSPLTIKIRPAALVVALGLSFHFAAQAQSPLYSSAIADSRQELGEFQINSVQVDGNTLLPASMVDAAFAGLTGPGRTLRDLSQAAARLQRRYRDAGYGGVLAFVPPQQLDGGTVLIRVVEGRLAEVRIEGNQHFSSQNIRSGLPGLREGSTPRVPEVDRDIQLSNENPAKALKVTLLAGSRPGEIDAEVRVQDRDPLRYSLALDNTGGEQTGRYRLTAGLQHANISDRDDILNAQFQTSPGHSDQVKVLGLGYRLPRYSSATSLDLFYAHSDVDNGITQTLAGPLAFAGQGRVFGARGNLHLERIGAYDHRIGLGLDWRTYDNDCAFLDLGALGSAACGSAAVSTQVLPLILSYTGQAQSSRLAWGGNASLFANLGGSSSKTFDAARPGARRNFFKARLSGFGEVQLPYGLAFRGDLEAQFSPHALLSGEQFGIGGAGSVRGYLERELAGDQGHALRLELRGPAFTGAGLKLRPHLFVDQGRVVKRQGAACGAGGATACQISAAGAGLRMDIGPAATASFEWGRARQDAIQTADGDWRVQAQLRFTF